MDLLTPEKINAQQKAGKNEAQERIQALAAEETRLIKSVTGLKEKENTIKEDLKITEAERDASLSVKKTILQTEVEILEARKFEALKPIELVKKEVEAEKKANKDQAEFLAKKEKDLLDYKSTLSDKEKNLDDRDSEILKSEKKIIEKEDEIVSKGNTILAALEEIKTKTEELTDKYREYYKKEDVLLERENTVLEREVKAMALEKANEITIQQFASRDIEQANKDREIADRYQTLERAISEAKKKYNI